MAISKLYHAIPRTRAHPEAHDSQANSSVRYRERRTANHSIQWNCHDEYSLQLTLNTSGRVVVGDYIGEFNPGNLILTGPRLPHNWAVSHTTDIGPSIHSQTLLFSDRSIREASRWLPEMTDALPLLSRACHGVEFLVLVTLLNAKCA